MLTSASVQPASNSTDQNPAPQHAPTTSPEVSLFQQTPLGSIGGLALPKTAGERRCNFEPGFRALSSPTWSSNSDARAYSESETGASASVSPAHQFNFARIAVTPPLVQHKLTIGSAGDRYELEADAVADKVMRMADPAPTSSAPSSTIQRKCARCGEEESAPAPPAGSQVLSGDALMQRKCARCEEGEATLQREATGTAATTVAPPSVTQALTQPGAPLPADVRAYMEPRFATDFSSVRVHTDAEAGRSADAVDARAYTVGQHIVFAPGAFAPHSEDGRRLIAHELTHVLQQRSGLQRLQRATRGAGGCASPDALDEDENGPTGAGRAAHNQIQSFLLPRIINEVVIPRGTKRAIDRVGCQPETVEAGRADLYLRGGSVHEIGEIKPIRQDMSHAVNEADHYIRRAGQSMDRFFAVGAMCPGATAGDDDRDFARRVGVSRLRPTFDRMTGILTTDTVIGAFDGDRSRTLKARLRSPGAIGYWCTGGQSTTYTCGVSDAETQRYIDEVALAPAQALLDQFLTETVERRLEQILAARSLGDILAIAERHFGAAIRQQLRPYLGPMADQILNQASAETIGRLIEESIGPEARAIVTTIVRRLTTLIVAELRRLLREALARLIREALVALCVGVPAVTLVELLDKLRQSFRDAARALVPVAIAAVAASIAQAIAAEIAAMLASMVAAIGRALGVISEVLAVVGEILLRVLAALAVLLLCAGVLILGFLAIAAIFDPVPGDEAALGAATLAVAALIPLLGRFIATGSTEERPGGA